jgi:predicted nucleic acid-binding protein
MSAFVVDASVGIKWYVPEVYDVDARRLQAPAHLLHVPTLWDVETANILWKKK